MGMMTMFSGGGDPSPMPNPRRFKILRSLTIIKRGTIWGIIEVSYPDCTNYEGRKILVYKGTMTYKLDQLKSLDPHFTESGIAPFARFEPTEEGWEGAISLARA